MRTNRWIAGFILLLLFSTIGVAQTTIPRVTENRLGFLSIDIFIDEKGSATIKEQYFFNYFAEEAEQFIQDFEENTPSLLEWKADYPFIKPHIGNESQTENIAFALNNTAEEQPSLTLTYTYPKGIVDILSSQNQGRSTLWKLSDIVLVQFINSGSILINEQTQIRIHIPSNGTINEKLLVEKVSLIDNTVTLTNFQSNALAIEYSVLTPIANPIDTGKFLEDFINGPLFIVLIVILGIIIAYGMINKEKISRKVEEYIVQNTELKPEQDQEIESIFETEQEGSP